MKEKREEPRKVATDNMCAKKLLKQSDGFLQNESAVIPILRSIPAGISISRLSDGVFVDVNDTLLQIFGYNRSEIIGRTYAELGLWVQPEQWQHVANKVNSEGQVQDLEMEFRRKTGEIGNLIVSAERIELDGEAHFLGIFIDHSNRKEVQVGVREDEQRYREVVEDLTELVCRFNEKGILTFVNDVCCRFFGKNKKDLLWTRWQPNVFPDDVPLVEELLRDMSPVNPVIVVENRIYNGAGEMRWMQFVNRSFYDVQGKLVETQAVGRDITERKLAEAASRESERRYRRLFEMEADAIVIVDHSTNRFIDANSAALNMYGYTKDELLQLSPVDLSAEPEKTRQAISESKCNVSSRLHHAKNGFIFPVEIVGDYFAWQGRQVHVATIRDITERVEAEKAIKESEERLKLALAASHMGVWEWNIQNDRVFWTKESYQIVGLEKFDGRLNSFTELIHPEDADRVWRASQKALDEKSLYKDEFRIIRPDGEVRWLSNLGRAEYDENGNAIRMVGTVADITEHKLADKALKRSERLLNESQRIGKLGGWEYDVISGISILSDEVYSIYGKQISTPAEGLEFYHKDDRPIVAEAFRRAKVEGVPYDLELRFLNAREENLYVRTIGSPVTEDGKIVRIVGILQDITERKHIEEKMRDYAHRLIEVQENERRALSRRLHDHIGNTLAAVNMNLTIVQSEQNWSSCLELGERLTDTIQKVTQVIELTRDIMTELRPPMLDEYGLASALTWLAGEFSRRTGVRVNIDVNTYRDRLPVANEITLFRIVQEALTNIAKHAHATSATIMLEQDVLGTRITIGDDGKGFDANRAQVPESSLRLGLSVMKERATAVKGTFKIYFTPGKGTTIVIMVPEEEDANHHLSGG